MQKESSWPPPDQDSSSIPESQNTSGAGFVRKDRLQSTGDQGEVASEGTKTFPGPYASTQIVLRSLGPNQNLPSAANPARETQIPGSCRLETRDAERARRAEERTNIR